MKVPKALTIAGSDSGGGAGIQADLKTFAALGVHGSCAITAITAQNTRGVMAIHNVPIGIVEAQIDAVMSDIGAGAVKIGMLSNSGIIKAVASSLKKHRVKKIVLDPVMVAASGAKLLEDSAIKSLKKNLMPVSLIVTPNIPEAEVLAGFRIKTRKDMKKAAKEILKTGCKSVLVKGGHLRSRYVLDFFTDGKNEVMIKHKRVQKEGHGTGCTLSSAIAAYIAKGHDVKGAVKKAIVYVHKALEKGYKAGSKNYVLGHFN